MYNSLHSRKTINNENREEQDNSESEDVDLINQFEIGKFARPDRIANEI